MKYNCIRTVPIDLSSVFLVWIQKKEINKNRPVVFELEDNGSTNADSKSFFL